MPIAEKKRTEAKRPQPPAAKPKPPAAAVPPAPPPAPPAAPEPALSAIDGWRDFETDPPIDMVVDCYKPSRIVELLSLDGSVERRNWAAYTTTSGGRAWGWCRQGAKPGGWCDWAAWREVPA